MPNQGKVSLPWLVPIYIGTFFGTEEVLKNKKLHKEGVRK